MSDLFEEDDDTNSVDVGDDFVDIEDEDLDVDSELEEVDHRNIDARRRLESMLDERRLRDELDDFGDY